MYIWEGFVLFGDFYCMFYKIIDRFFLDSLDFFGCVSCVLVMFMSFFGSINFIVMYVDYFFDGVEVYFV